jgi:butyryl-CoA dehydrogenase/short/branched chain acyl-CoA dehydrogenase
MTTPLTVLTEEEALFRDTIREFAEREIGPRVDKMERDGHYDPEIIPMLFDLGVMGIEIPEEYGGSGGSFFMSILAIEELSRVDAAVAVLVDVQNTLVANARGACSPSWPAEVWAPTRSPRRTRAAMPSRWRRARWRTVTPTC